MGSNPTVTATENPWLSGGFLHFRGDRGGSLRRAVHWLVQLQPMPGWNLSARRATARDARPTCERPLAAWRRAALAVAWSSQEL